MDSTDTSLRIVKIKNPFDRSTREINDYPYNGQALQRLVDVFLPSDIEFAVSINGEIIKRENWPQTKAKAGDYIVFVPVVSGGGGDDKSMFTTILMIAVVIAAPMVVGWLGFTTGTLAFALATAAVVVAGGMLVNTLMPRPQLRLSEAMFGVSEISQISQVYGWNPQTTQKQGLVVPKFYGKNKIYGNIIAVHTEVGEGDDTQLLKMLVALGQGPVKSISDKRLNDQPVANYPDVTTEQRLGLIDQTVISFFTETKPEYRPTIKINNGSPRTYETPDDDFDDLEVDLYFPRGIFFANNAGGLDSHSVGVKVEVSIHEADDWTTIGEETVTENTTGRLWKSYKASDSMAIVNGNKYDIRVTKTTADKTSTRYGDNLYLCGVREVINDNFNYPSTALIGISALATDQLSGSIRFSCLMEGAIVQTYDGESWTLEYSDNPAWVLYDILTQPVISGDGGGTAYAVERYNGIQPSRIDAAKFYELAQFCDADTNCPDGKGGTEKRMTFNGGVDIGTTLWEAALKICEVARCVLIWNGTALTLAIDKAADPVQMFSVGNVEEDSFRETFLPEKDRASEIEVRYRDADHDYKLTPFTIFNTAIPNAANKVTLELFGLTKQSQAWRAGMYRLAQNQLLKRILDFNVDIDAIACTVGDVINIQHDVPNWGMIGSGSEAYNAGGRIVSTDLEGANHKVTIDCNLAAALDPGKTYEIMVRLSDDTIETKTITGIVEIVVTISGTFTGTPAKDDVWAIGEQNLVTKPYRILNLERAGDQRCKITAIEYDAAVYANDAATPILPAPAVTPPEADGDLTKPPTWQDVVNQAPQEVLGVPTLDIPLTSNLKWNDDTPDGDSISWSKNDGTNPILMIYKGTTYEITPANTNKNYVYWDKDSSPTTFKSTDTIGDAIGADKWMMCINNEGTAEPSTLHKVVTAGLIQVGTLSAITAALGSITSGQVLLSLGGDNRLRLDASGLYGSWDAGETWKQIIGIVGGRVTLSFDSYESDDVIVGVGAQRTEKTQLEYWSSSIVLPSTDWLHYYAGADINPKELLHPDEGASGDFQFWVDSGDSVQVKLSLLLYTDPDWVLRGEWGVHAITNTVAKMKYFALAYPIDMLVNVNDIYTLVLTFKASNAGDKIYILGSSFFHRVFTGDILKV